MRHYLIVLLSALLFLCVPDSHGQSAPLAEAPVRYDTDLLPPEFHQHRRNAVLDALPDHAVAVLFSAPARNRENDVNFEYRQSSNLYYLTGMHEPASLLLLAPGGMEVDGETVTELLMTPSRNPGSEIWTGRRFGPERAQEQLGLQKVVSTERFGDILAALAARDGTHFFHLPLPSDIGDGSTLGRQLALFKQHAHPLEIGGNPLARNAMYLVQNTTSEENFTRFQSFAKNRLDPANLEGSPLQPVVEAFINAASFDEWQTWKRENLDAQYADGTTLSGILNALRMEKTDEELVLLQRAIDITAAAHREAMRSIEPGMYEYEAEALIEYIFRRNGAEYTGFPSIVGSGENSVVLHYESNRRQMQDGDVVVMDIGAEYHGYSADVTRTVPVNGTFSPEQRAIYELVLKAQDAGIEATRAGNSFRAPHTAAAQVIAAGLRELGLIQDDNGVRRFFMHGTSHYLGLYVHDVGTGGDLTPGTVITVEPGIYISPSPDVDPKWWNIGVRIEDDVLITTGDPVVLSAGAPRTVTEIEALMQEPGLGNEPAGLIERTRPVESTPRGGQ
ncbi:MAG: aminopeptidase P N-terminal domain-containing protein [Rhodothermales bacterium]